jgi:hypothetical protein
MSPSSGQVRADRDVSSVRETTVLQCDGSSPFRSVEFDTVDAFTGRSDASRHANRRFTLVVDAVPSICWPGYSPCVAARTELTLGWAEDRREETSGLQKGNNAMNIKPIHPADLNVDKSAAPTGLQPALRTFSIRHNGSRRTFSIRHGGSRRAFGMRLPSRRVFGGRIPSRRTFG